MGRHNDPEWHRGGAESVSSSEGHGSLRQSNTGWTSGPATVTRGGSYSVPDGWEVKLVMFKVPLDELFDDAFRGEESGALHGVRT